MNRECVPAGAANGRSQPAGQDPDQAALRAAQRGTQENLVAGA